MNMSRSQTLSSSVIFILLTCLVFSHRERAFCAKMLSYLLQEANLRFRTLGIYVQSGFDYLVYVRENFSCTISLMIPPSFLTSSNLDVRNSMSMRELSIYNLVFWILKAHESYVTFRCIVEARPFLILEYSGFHIAQGFLERTLCPSFQNIGRVLMFTCIK